MYAFVSFARVAAIETKRRCNSACYKRIYRLFLSGIWGKTAIDYHFVPHEEAKRSLCTRFRIERHRVIVTGIPIHEHIVPAQK